MNFFKKVKPYKWQLVEFYCKSLSDISNVGGIHNYQFTTGGIIYRPSEWMLNFFISVLQQISRLGLTNQKTVREMNRWNVQNLLCAENRPWTETDVSQILSASEGSLILIN